MKDKDHSWRPSATLETLRIRAQWLKTIREFFEERGVLEVETPILSPASVPDPHIESLYTQVNGQTAYLQTSPELYMKRLLAAGSGPIYQASRVFRGSESGNLHNPEFTLIEWYRPGFDQQQLMNEVADLVLVLCESGRDAMPVEFISYRDLFIKYTQIDPFGKDWSSLTGYCEKTKQPCPVDDDWQAAMDWVLATSIQPQMQGCVFVTSFPAVQASLARLDPDAPSVARRFELFIDGVEMANGFEELIDAAEQRARFQKENESRLSMGLEAIPIDEHFLAALEAGMPETSGVALGLDRLLMWKLGAEKVQDVMSFPGG